ncbi:PH domain-containing protein [Streptomyces capparidis]
MGEGPEFRRLHPVTPWRRAWAVLAAVAAVLLQNPGQAGRLGGALGGWQGPAVVAALVAVAFAYGFVSWWFTRYRVDDVELRVDTGVLVRRTKHLRIDRLQAVDLDRPLIGRLIGVATLRLDLAGGKDELAYLTERDARALRAELLARAAGVAPDSGEAPQHELVRVPPGALAVALLLRPATWWAVAGALVLALVPALLTGAWVAALVALPGLLMAGRATVGRYAAEYGWTVAQSPDGLRIDHGLLDRRHETVPPGRVQALAFEQPLPWRRRDWVRVRLAVAGGGNDVLLPVAPREVALATVARIWPGVDITGVPLLPVPRRARWRAPVWRRTLAYGADARVFVVRQGLLTRTVRVVPHAKVQSVRRTQGPWQRALGLACVHLDIAAGGSLTAAHRDADEAARVVAEQADRSRTGRRTAGPERWMTG